jgi:hypothetical protein
MENDDPCSGEPVDFGSRGDTGLSGPTVTDAGARPEARPVFPTPRIIPRREPLRLPREVALMGPDMACSPTQCCCPC